MTIGARDVVFRRCGSAIAVRLTQVHRLPRLRRFTIDIWPVYF
jgi:hypothetical protein